MTHLTATTAAANIANVWNASRQANIPAIAAFEVVLNASLGRHDVEVVQVSVHNMEISFSDGSILTVLDTTAAYIAGIAAFPYSYKSQDQLC